ncbi:PAS domain-containing protein [Faecalicatena contorta]|nr:PAS domain-containing protein [Faecalicatena contorta]
MKIIGDLAPCGIGLYDLETSEPIFLNKAYYKLIGYTEEEYQPIKTDFDALMFPQDTPVTRQSKFVFDQEGEATGYEYRIVRKDGQIRWVKLNVSKVNFGGQEFAFTSFTDITGEKEVASQLSLIAENAGSSMSLIKIIDNKKELIYANDAFFHNVGVERVQYQAEMEAFISAAVSETDCQRIWAAARTALSSGKPADITHRYLRPDGKTLWLNRRFAAIKQDSPDTFLIVSIVTDVTKEKEAELNTALEQSRFRTVISELNAAVFEWNLKDGSFYSSEAYQNYAISDVSNEDILNNRGPADIVHPDDRAELQRFFAETSSGSSNERVEVTLRLKMKNGTFHWCRMIAFFYGDTEGTPTRTIGVLIDINEEQERMFLLNNLLDEVPAGIGIYEIKGGQASLLNLNAAYYNMLGAEPAARKQFLGTNSLEAVHPKDRKIIESAILRLKAGEDKVNALYRAKCGDGQWKWLNLTACAVERRENFIKVYAAFSDCDEMMRTQQELQNNRTMLNAALASAQVMEWRYDFKRKIVTDSGAFGTNYGWPKVIENIPDVFLDAGRDGLIHQDSVEDFAWLFAHCGEGRRIQKDIRCKSPDGSKYIWQRVIYTPVFDKNGMCKECIGTAVNITEQKEREQNYEEQLRLRKVAAQEALAMASYNLTQNRMTEAESSNPELYRIMSCTTVDDVLRGIRECSADAEEEKRFLPVYDCKTMLRAFENGTTHIEIRHHLKHDSRWVQSSFDMLVNPYTGDVEAASVLRDITDMVRAELVVNRLLDVDYQIIMTVDAKTGAVQPFKNGMKEAHLKAFTEIQAGLDVFENTENADRTGRENSLQYIKQQLEKMAVYDSLYVKRTGDKPVYKRIMYTYLENSRDTILCAVQDVSDTYEQEEKQKEALARALHAAEEASHSKSEFLSRMSHDMRTPMNGILGLAELSSQENDPNILKDYIARMKESGIYLLSLINDTLDFQRIERGKMQLNKQIVYIKTLYESIVALIKPSVEKKKIDFQIVNHNADLDWYVYLDPVRIKQIFVNLLSNAVKFTPAGGSIIMDIQYLAREGMISHNCIKIIDHGIGMSEEFVKTRLFTPFEQEQNMVSSQYAGSGLGLSITRNLLEMMGGRIEVESALGRGTTMSVYLDFEQVDSEKALKSLTNDQNERTDTAEKLSGKQVLLVEDHPLNAKIAQTLLERVGCTVYWMDNGQKGVQAFEDSPVGAFDAVLMDIRMPILDGLEAAKAIRMLNRADAKTVPIIAMTANAYDEDRKKSKESGMNMHLTKPIEPAILYEALKKYMEL